MSAWYEMEQGEDFTARYGSLLDRIDPREFTTKAMFAARELDLIGFAYVHLSPRDGTRYEFSIVRPPTNEQWQTWERRRCLPPDHEHYQRQPEFNDKDHYLVAHSLRGGLYPWHGCAIHPDYAFAKWTSMRHGTPDDWTAYIVARFLTVLSAEITARRNGEW